METKNKLAEAEQLDCQRARLEELLANEPLSPDLSKTLKRLLDDVAHRLVQIKKTQRPKVS